MHYLGCSSGTIRSWYEINKTSKAAVVTTVEKTPSITVVGVVKWGAIFGPIMCWSSSSRVNAIQSEISVW